VALEKKWAYAQQNNYAIRDAVETRKAETDVEGDNVVVYIFM
jgi:hypothetical protein